MIATEIINRVLEQMNQAMSFGKGMLIDEAKYNEQEFIINNYFEFHITIRWFGRRVFTEMRVFEETPTEEQKEEVRKLFITHMATHGVFCGINDINKRSEIKIPTP